MSKDQTFKVRDYERKDYSQVAVVWQETGISTPGRGDTAAVIAGTLKHGGRLLVLQEKSSGTIIGTSWLTSDGRRLYLHHFAITPSYQGQGLSKLLLNASLKIAKQTGLQIKLEVHRDNAKAISLYKAYGFKRLGDYDIYIIRDLCKIKIEE
jgi:ribosomal protein S18 acetylase RimI-like enzyme